MLIHVVPRLLEPIGPPVNATLLDVVIPELGLYLVAGEDIKACRPHPNKRYLVACSIASRKAEDGILIEVDGSVRLYTVVTRWLVDEVVTVHFVQHSVADEDFDAVSNDVEIWLGKAGTSFQCRRPVAGVPYDDLRSPLMEVVPTLTKGESAPEAVRDVVDENGRLISRVHLFEQPTIERERLLSSDRIYEWQPRIEHAFKAKPVDLPPISESEKQVLVACLSSSERSAIAIDDLIAEFDADPDMALHMAKARVWIEEPLDHGSAEDEDPSRGYH